MTRLVEFVRRLRWKPLAAVAALALFVSAPWWGVALLARLDFFRVHRIEVLGTRYIVPNEILARLRVDTTTSVWIDLHVLERCVATHPQVRGVTVERNLPGTLVVHVTENLPVAFLPQKDGLVAVDATGHRLPIDPSLTSVDLPVIARVDPALLRVLADVRERQPELFDRISDARRAGRDELVLQLASVRVLALADVSAGRLADIVPVERDLARRNARVAELDLRFRDQVIARLQ